MKYISCILALIVLYSPIRATETTRIIPNGTSIFSYEFVGYNEDWNYYFATTADGHVHGWDKASGKLLYSVNAGESLVLSKDLKLFASISDDKKIVTVYSTQTGAEVYRLSEKKAEISKVCFSGDGVYIATVEAKSNRFYYSLWDAKSGSSVYQKQIVAGIKEHATPQIKFSNDGLYIVTAAPNEHNIKVWETKTGNIVHTLEDDGEWRMELVFCNDCNYILSYDITKKQGTVWDLKKGWRISTFNSDEGLAFVGEFSKGGNYLLVKSVLVGNKASVLAAANAQQLYTVKPKGLCFIKPGFSTDGNFLFDADSSGSLNKRQANSGKIIFTINDSYLTGIDSIMRPSTFFQYLSTIDNEYIITSSVQGEIKVWNGKTGQNVLALNNKKSSGLKKITLSDDGKNLIEIGYKNARIWDFKSGKLIHEF